MDGDAQCLDWLKADDLQIKHNVKAKLTMQSTGNAGGEGPRTHIQGSFFPTSPVAPLFPNPHVLTSASQFSQTPSLPPSSLFSTRTTFPQLPVNNVSPTLPIPLPPFSQSASSPPTPPPQPTPSVQNSGSCRLHLHVYSPHYLCDKYPAGQMAASRSWASSPAYSVVSSS